jgi:hypothetical protein
MSIIISLSVLGVLILFMGILKKKSWLLPTIFVLEQEYFLFQRNDDHG